MKSYIDYYNGRYIYSVFASVISAPLFFLTGSAYYFFLKYGRIPQLDTGDYLVFIAFILLLIFIALIAHLRNFGFHIQQLEQSLEDIENETLDRSALTKYSKRRQRKTFSMSISLVSGVIILLLMVLLLK